MSIFRHYAARMSIEPHTVALPPLDSAQVAQRLRMYMGDKKLSRSKLALASGINRTSLATKLDGHVDFTLHEIAAIAAAIGKSWWWLLAGEDPPQSSFPVDWSIRWIIWHESAKPALQAVAGF